MEKTLKISILGKDYIIKYPNVGQMLDIESLKIALTNGAYGDLVRMGTKSSIYALDIADTIATFSVLIPEIKDSLNVKTYSELDQFTAKKLLNAYKNTFFEWFNNINKDIRAFGDDGE